ncbi:hypothetical protein O9992_03715 [Vibrio lentus]|nr:hypothetical protein [Vibrio lentus]
MRTPFVRVSAARQVIVDSEEGRVQKTATAQSIFGGMLRGFGIAGSARPTSGKAIRRRRSRAVCFQLQEHGSVDQTDSLYHVKENHVQQANDLAAAHVDVLAIWAGRKSEKEWYQYRCNASARQRSPVNGLPQPERKKKQHID